MLKFLFAFVLICQLGLANRDDKANLLTKSWIEEANAATTDFPLQNLPLGVFKKSNLLADTPRIGTAIGNKILDIKGCVQAKLLDELPKETREALLETNLNNFMKLGRQQNLMLRNMLTALLQRDNPKLRDDHLLRNQLIIPEKEVELLLPFIASDYTDFYSPTHQTPHVTIIPQLNGPLPPNYTLMPIGESRQTSSISMSGTSIPWPIGQIVQADGKPALALSNKVDYEFKMGIVIGKSNPLATQITIESAHDHIFGYALVNEWLAQDIQKEASPGAFKGKTFATTISPWVVTAIALEPFQRDVHLQNRDEMPLLDDLTTKNNLPLNITVEIYILSEKMRKAALQPLLMCQKNLSAMHWNFQQMFYQHSLSNLNIGDLSASSPRASSLNNSSGCLLEKTALSSGALKLPDGSTRTYLQDGDEIILHAYAEKEGYPRIGFGTCRSRISKNTL